MVYLQCSGVLLCMQIPGNAMRRVRFVVVSNLDISSFVDMSSLIAGLCFSWSVYPPKEFPSVWFVAQHLLKPLKRA